MDRQKGRHSLIAIVVAFLLIAILAAILFVITLKVFPDFSLTIRSVLSVLSAAIIGALAFFSGLKDTYDFVIDLMERRITNKSAVTDTSADDLLDHAVLVDAGEYVQGENKQTVDSKTDGGQSSVPEWQRGLIAQWDQRSMGYEPIPLEQNFNVKSLYHDFGELFPKPLLGKENIPFLIRYDSKGEYICGIKLKPAHAMDKNVSQEITPGVENAVAAYVLLSAMNAWRIKHGVKWEGRRIGYLRFRMLTMEYEVPLVLGKNVRNWSFRETDDTGVVDTLTDSTVEQVWRSPDDRFTLDMLRVDLNLGAEDFPISRHSKDIKMLQVVAECEGVPPNYPREDLPYIWVSGLTYMCRTTFEPVKKDKIGGGISETAIQLRGKTFVGDGKKTYEASMDGLKRFLNDADEQYNQGRLNFLSFVNDAKAILRHIYREGGEYGLAGEKADDNPHSPYKMVANFLFDKERSRAAKDLLVERWHELAGLQIGEHLYRASISMQLAEYYDREDDGNNARKWTWLTYADDLLHGTREGNAEQWLKTKFDDTKLERVGTDEDHLPFFGIHLP